MRPVQTRASTGQRRRVLFFAEAVTLAHVARPVVLAQALDPTHYEVHLAVHPRYDSLFPTLPFARHRLHTIPTQQFLRALAKGSPVYDTATLWEYVRQDLSLIREVRPDLVVGDFRLSLAVSARLAGVPYATITNAYWSPYAKVRFPIPEHPLSKIVGLTTAQWLFSMTRPAIFAAHCRPLNRTCCEFGQPRLGWDLRRVYTDADYVLYADLPELVPMRELPDTHRFIGPIIWSPHVPLPDWWDKLPGDRPIIYVTLGSSGRGELLPVVLAALAELPVRVIVATAGRTLPGQVPPNAFVADYLPGQEACHRASLVICNGGSPTTYQALSEGKPVLGIPSNLDQHLNMQGVVRLGAGQMLRSSYIAGSVASATGSMLRDLSVYREAAAKVLRCFARYDPIATDSYLSERFVREMADRDAAGSRA